MTRLSLISTLLLALVLSAATSQAATGTCTYDAATQTVYASGVPTGVPLNYLLIEASGTDLHFAFVGLVSTDGTAVFPLDYVGPTYVTAEIIGPVTQGKRKKDPLVYTVYASCPLT